MVSSQWSCHWRLTADADIAIIFDGAMIENGLNGKCSVVMGTPQIFTWFFVHHRIRILSSLCYPSKHWITHPLIGTITSAIISTDCLIYDAICLSRAQIISDNFTFFNQIMPASATPVAGSLGCPHVQCHQSSHTQTVSFIEWRQCWVKIYRKLPAFPFQSHHPRPINLSHYVSANTPTKHDKGKPTKTTTTTGISAPHTVCQQTENEKFTCLIKPITSPVNLITPVLFFYLTCQLIFISGCAGGAGWELPAWNIIHYEWICSPEAMLESAKSRI